MARWEDTFWWPIEGNFFPVYNFCLELTTSVPTVTATGRLLFDTTWPTIMFDDGAAMRLVPVMTTSGDLSATHLVTSSGIVTGDTLQILTTNAVGANLILQQGTSGAPSTSKTIRALGGNFDLVNDNYTAVILSVTDSGKALLPLASTAPTISGSRKYLVMATSDGSIYVSTGVEP